MSQTQANLATAFLGESQARNKYTFWASTARKEGFQQIAAIFLETAEQEIEHAEWVSRMFTDLKEGDNIILPEVKVELPFGDTIANLKSAIAGEHYENAEMYPAFAKIAEEEGHQDIARRLRNIATAELHHEGRYQAFLQELLDKTVFAKSEPVTWVCRKCGFMFTGNNAPDVCPSCDHKQEYYQVRCCDKM